VFNRNIFLVKLIFAKKQIDKPYPIDKDNHFVYKITISF